MEVHLKPVTVHNWKDCIALELAPEQQLFVPSNLYSIAEAQFYPEAQSCAIVNETDEMIGYTLFGREAYTRRWKIFRIMIDQHHQNKGYGKAAMQKIIATIAQESDVHEILIAYQANNQTARNLYATLGFHEQNMDENGKVTALLTLDAPGFLPNDK